MNNPNLSTANYISLSIDILCVIISLIIYACLFLERDRNSRMNRLFRYFVLCNIGITSSDAAAWLMRGNMEWYGFYLVRISNFLHYAFGSFILLAITFYMLEYIALKVKVNRKLIYTHFIICFASLLLVIVSQFNNMYYIIDENNLYHRQSFYWLSQALPASGILINIGTIIFYRKVMRFRSVLFFMLYMVVPFAAMAVQFMFYGVTLVNVGITLTILFLYIYVQTELTINFESTIKAINRQLALQGDYYKSLQSHIEETKKARHDLRHHLSVIQSYAAAGETEKLNGYLNEYVLSLPHDADIIFCENFAVNSLLCYYIGIAKSEGIQVDTRLELPADIGISDTDLCIIFGNCVENAIEACRKLTEGKFIKINSRLTGKLLTITIDNSFNGEIKKEGDVFLSNKHEGKPSRGIGISSVKAVVQKYGESAQFATHSAAHFAVDGNVFQVTIILKVLRE